MDTPGDIILYETEDGHETVRLRVVNETVWLSQRQMAEHFNVSQDNISLHLKNIYGDGELREETTSEESSVVQIEGAREVRRPLTEARPTMPSSRATYASSERSVYKIHKRAKRSVRTEHGYSYPWIRIGEREVARVDG